MKTLQKSLLALSASALLATGANAAISYGSTAGSQAYVGVKVGQIDADQVNKKTTAYGVYGGYNFDERLGVEAEFIGSDKKDFDTNLEGKTKSYGAYGTYRYNFNNTPIYAKGKLGVAKTETDVNSKSGNYTSTTDTTGVAGGVALGYKPNNNFGIEAGYNYLSSDAKMLSLGAHFAF
ncbi:porin family protein [Moraxella sp.]|uniref:porin family protein n=1 Tax=Moraxella sp. TaxID=479 RepID=UPI0026DB0ED9|nr:porin family protein [Moraxella sp.]MDO4894962.1 porin family protein [Moraxella sp.]